MPGSLDNFGILRGLLAFAPYEPKPTAPDWLARFARLASDDNGVLALLGPGGISAMSEDERRSRAFFDPAALYLAALSNSLRGTSKRFAVGIPPGGRHLPLLLAASAVLGRTMEYGQPDRGSGVLVISPDLDVRSRYCDLSVASVQLDDAHPGSRLRRSGERIPLNPRRANTEADGVCFFLPPVSLPERIQFHPALILLDLRYAKWQRRTSELVAWVGGLSRSAGIISFYSLGDTDTELALKGSGFIDLPLDHPALAAFVERLQRPKTPEQALTVDWGLVAGRSFLSRTHRVRAISDAQTLERLFEDAGTLLDDHRKISSPSLNRARWLQATLTQIPVPLIWYEEAARSLGRSTLRRLIDRLGTESRLDKDRGPVIQSLRMLFDLIYKQMEQGNRRAECLKELVTELVSRAEADATTLILLRDRVMALALSNWFDIELFHGAAWLPGVDILDYSRYADAASTRYRFALVNGAFPRRHRWVAGAALADEVLFLLYDHEIQTVVRQLEQVYGKDSVALRAERRRSAMEHVAPHAKGPRANGEEACADLVLELPSRRPTDKAPKKRTVKAVLRGLAGLRDALESAKRAEEEARKREVAAGGDPLSTWREDSSDDNPPDEAFDIGEHVPHPDDATCLVVHVNSRLQGKGILLLQVDDAIECVRPSEPDDITIVTPHDLVVGDVVLVVEEGGRSRLFDRIVDLAENQPSLKHLQAHRHVWRQAVERMASLHRLGTRVEYGALLRKLRESGATVTSELAVRFWVEGQVIGPEKKESIIAVGRVSGVDALVRKAKEFDRAFETIRSIRRGIGRRLSTAIRRSFKHFAEGEPEEIEAELDERLGIAVDELIDTIDLAEVLETPQAIEKVPPNLVGRFTAPKREA